MIKLVLAVIGCCASVAILTFVFSFAKQEMIVTNVLLGLIAVFLDNIRINTGG